MGPSVARLVLAEPVWGVAAAPRVGGDRHLLTLRGDAHAATATEVAEVRHYLRELLALEGLVVPVTWTPEPRVEGYWRAASANVELLYAEDTEAAATWQLDLERVGGPTGVQMETRLTGQSLATDHAVAAERWHAPARGHDLYRFGSESPGSIVRVIEGGANLRVYRGLVSTTADPLWHVPPTSYYAGSARLLADGRPVHGLEYPPGVTADTWQLDNGLVRVTPTANGRLDIACWDPELAAWSVKRWKFEHGAATVNRLSEPAILRNDADAVAIRLFHDVAPGRVVLDLTLHRGARAVDGYLQRHAAATLKVVRDTAEAATAETGRIRATANDAAGNRYVLGSARTFATDLVNGGISKAAVTALDFFAGAAVGGSAAQAGDTPGDLLAQYLGTPDATTVAVRR